MDIILSIFAILGVGVIAILQFAKKLIFKSNIEFHKILQSFPIISEHKINDGTKTNVNSYKNIQISKELTEFVESKKNDLDEFLAKLEKFDEHKLKFKKDEIKYFIRNIKRLLTSKSAKITINATLDFSTKKLNTEMKGKSFEWSAFNYLMINEIMKDDKKIDKLFICKFLNF